MSHRVSFTQCYGCGEYLRFEMHHLFFGNVDVVCPCGENNPFQMYRGEVVQDAHVWPKNRRRRGGRGSLPAQQSAMIRGAVVPASSIGALREVSRPGACGHGYAWITGAARVPTCSNCGVSAS